MPEFSLHCTFKNLQGWRGRDKVKLWSQFSKKGQFFAYQLHACFLTSAAPAVRGPRSRHHPGGPLRPSLTQFKFYDPSLQPLHPFVLSTPLSQIFSIQSKSHPRWLFPHIFTKDDESRLVKNIEQCYLVSLQIVDVSPWQQTLLLC